VNSYVKGLKLTRGRRVLSRKKDLPNIVPSYDGQFPSSRFANSSCGSRLTWQGFNLSPLQLGETFEDIRWGVAAISKGTMFLEINFLYWTCELLRAFFTLNASM